ncbi:hypothetical protein LguiA_001457 [Lonicera macranthoides]
MEANGTVTIAWKPTESSLCNWMGISCSGDKVTGIDLYNSTIFGKLFGNFSAILEITHLNLSQNMISGEIPANLGRCQKLKYLNLTHNKIDGAINLTTLHLIHSSYALIILIVMAVTGSRAFSKSEKWNGWYGSGRGAGCFGGLGFELADELA